ncbi:DUF1972 domain-containing protein [Martelella sp. HB161492]|uniref:DUF1972 domain-containing protein n=1 Tax=Martelella sp. HB161492 TaxID=2720726 RepID=UPI00158FD72F
MQKHLNILGIRGIPAAHGGFETFAHYFTTWLVEKGWTVTVYCQHDKDEPGAPADYSEDTWEGVHRVHILSRGNGPASTMKFDLKCVRDVLKRPGIDLVLGYNTAVLSILQRLWGRKVLMNMDGIEWKRDKWSLHAKIWLWINEIVGAHICNTPIADHPEIARHLSRHGTRNIEIIPYASQVIADAPVELITPLGIESGRYLVSIARIEPENSILEIVRTFSCKKRHMKLVVLGSFKEEILYHREVKGAASDEVIFPGAIYDPATVSALRFHSRAYLHGHQVGGTNPSLVEALGAGNAVIAHDNRFNKWVAGDGQFYFKDEAGLDDAIGAVASDDERWNSARYAARRRHMEEFSFEKIHQHYLSACERLLT